MAAKASGKKAATKKPDAKKPTSKKKSSSEFDSVRETGVVLDRIYSEVKAIGEQYGQVTKQIENIDKKTASQRFAYRRLAGRRGKKELLPSCLPYVNRITSLC